ncbi:MAG: HAMP domain-containing sensor histidine kinase [bacterium]|nr:HAMP domain-containing sensor histidine kinase [bacterium]
MPTAHSKKIRLAKIGGAVLVLFYVVSMWFPLHPALRVAEAVLLIALLGFIAVFVRGVRQQDAVEEKIELLEHRLRQSEWKLAVANERVQVLDQRKSEFVSVVSHQLRAPITAIKGYSSMLIEESYGKLPERIKEPVHKIFLSSKRVAEMVTDFLDLTKIEQGTIMYNFTSVDIGILVADLIGEYGSIAKKRGLTLDVNFPNDKLLLATADESKIRQVLSNLIDNALKYTEKGGVRLILEKDGEKGVIRVTVKDTGMGLSQDDIQNLFQKFGRGSRGQKQFTEGSGLGLYVAKKMLESHKGGKLWVDSEGVGKGSTFVLELLAEESAS